MKILFIDIDTLRPDHMGCYGYARETTPNIDQVAAQGLRFSNYYCSDAPCLPSRASLVTGMFGLLQGAAGHGGTAADKRLFGAERGFRDPIDEHNLHNVFRRAGMYTASVSTFAERHSSWWFNAGFNECHNVGGGGGESGEEVLPAALDWLRRNRMRENWFLHVHLWDPHTPYRAPASFGNPFESAPLPEWITEEVFARHLRHTGPHSINEINMYDDATNPRYPRQPGRALDLAGLRNVIDGYDCGVAYADSLVGQVFGLLREQGIWDDVAVMVTSDHGENMGELGIYSEHATADHATCRIPFIIKWPGAAHRVGQEDSALHYSLDLAPTMAELLGVPQYKLWSGRSWADTLHGGAPCGRESLVISQMAHVCQRSARFGKWLYMRTYHDGYHLFPAEMLFDIEADPHEQCDLAAERPEICAQGAKIILDWHDGELLRVGGGLTDPMWTVLDEGGPFHAHTDLPAYIARLERTGRADGAAALKKRYGVK